MVRGAIEKPVEVHKGKIYVMLFNQTDSKLYTGGEDGVINVF